MARIRSVKPEFWTDEKVAELSRDARLTFLGLISALADDEGRMKGNPRVVRGMIYPFDEDVTGAHVEAHLEELDQLGLIVRYEVNGERYIALPKWTKHQRIDRPMRSRLPAPPAHRMPASDPAIEADPIDTGDGATEPVHERSTNGPRMLDDQSRPKRSGAEAERDREWDKERSGSEALVDARARFLARFYANASTDRLAEVNEQIDRALSPAGLVSDKQGIRAFATEASFARAVADLLRDPRSVRNLDRAIVVLLKKLTDGRTNADTDARGRTVTEAASEDGKRQESADRVTLDRDLARFASWAAEHPSDAARIEAEVVAELPGPSDNAFLEHARSVKRVHVWQREQRASRAVALSAGGAA